MLFYVSVVNIKFFLDTLLHSQFAKFKQWFWFWTTRLHF